MRRPAAPFLDNDVFLPIEATEALDLDELCDSHERASATMMRLRPSTPSAADKLHRAADTHSSISFFSA